VNLLTNGYDEDDFKAINRERAGRFIIRHVGIINERCDPRPFLAGFRRAMKEDRSFSDNVQLEFIGEVHAGVISFVRENAQLNEVTRFYGNIPHKQLLSMYGSSALLLLILTGYKHAEGYLPGKAFEYLACGLPILGVGPVNGDAAVILRESGAGKMFEGDDEAGISKELLDIYHRWGSLRTPQYTDAFYASKFSRKEITEKLVRLLELPSD